MLAKTPLSMSSLTLCAILALVMHTGAATENPPPFNSGFKEHCDTGSIEQTAINEGDRIPGATVWGYDVHTSSLVAIDTAAHMKDKRVLMLGLSGIWIKNNLNGALRDYLWKAKDFKQKLGVDRLVIFSTDDAYAQRGLFDSEVVNDLPLHFVEKWADSNLELTKKMGLVHDRRAEAYGIRSRRFGLVADDGVVKILALEQGNNYRVSEPDNIYKELKRRIDSGEMPAKVQARPVHDEL